PHVFGEVAVILGGRTSARAVSQKSCERTLIALRKKAVDAHAFDSKKQTLDALVKDRFDRVFIALHGRYGEDGTLQGALEVVGTPYTGSGVLGSALAMDKWRTKLVWQGSGIPTPHSELLTRESDLNGVTTRLGLPLMVKPANEGSSIGMTKVKSARDLPEAYALAANYDRVVIAEAFVDGVELTVGVLGDMALPLIKLETPREFYDYAAKYSAVDTRYIIPCGLPPDAERIIQDEAQRAFRILGCSGWGRVDLMLDSTGKPYFLEVNTSPGMTDHSLVPMAARHAGLSFEDLCLRRS